MTYDLHPQWLSVTAIARRTGHDRKTVRKYLARGLEAPAYGPRAPRPRLLAPFEGYLRARVRAVPEMIGSRLWRELRGLGQLSELWRWTGVWTKVTLPHMTWQRTHRAEFSETPHG